MQRTQSIYAERPSAGQAVIGNKHRSTLQISAMVGQHIGDRKEQQDRVGVYSSASAPKCALAVLADGMGGRSGGAIAAETVLLTAKRLFDEFSPNESSAQDFFQAMVSEAHLSIHAAAYASGMEPHATLVACLIQPDRVDWCHVGDSRLYVYRDDVMIHQTRDHTVGAKMVDDGLLPPDRARLHPSAAKLTNAIGGKDAPVPAMMGLNNVQAGDRFLICSDGLWAYYNDAELLYLMHNTTGVNRTKLLIDEARTRAAGKGDNCSLIALELSAN